MHPTSVKFCDVLDDMKAMHCAKSADYGLESDPLHNLRRAERFGVEPWLGTLVRLGDKVTRLERYAKKRTLRNEGFEDTLIDLACYAVLVLLLFREDYEARASAVAEAEARASGGDDSVGDDIGLSVVHRPVVAPLGEDD